ncbi:hypothetical protein CC80DRAFT_496214 [Byssothecium circinans]|uniref:Ams2/SPT21 N-terminal domain-containing protein n=1 Tax=Byssothecium circinans TaxID=147558 RepID=A0A6A5TF04_9PLEO|nr:hypothetical protein CC80DRAFT_496214 [Byssothecium circinans]
MATPSNSTGTDVAVQQAAATSPADNNGEAMKDIPRRLMRVKVLYTFDDQNKSNCLARLPHALSIPAVSLDETTQVGVIELKTCIQAVVAASPELVAKLGHDYTVYAYDYSEYETPLVGQGMLSWVLASASATPNAPADQSETMVTGRVCKNILGLFSNGIKETLEVKLKLVPVPTCMQSEYVENLERYHNLSKIMPEELRTDYSAWADFLNANPAIRQLAQPDPVQQSQASDRQQSGGVESFHDMLTRQSPSADAASFDSFQDRRMSYGTYGTRPSSPAPSTASFHQHHYGPNPSRPASQASFRSSFDQEEQEEGPQKKRARITKAKRPKKAAVLGVNHDSLRVTASSAASVRNHRPLNTNAAPAVSIEQVPRAPTPRPGLPGMPFGRGPLRAPAPSLLRHGSIDSGRSYTSPYEVGVFSDNALESADEGRGRSPAETPSHMPSSPPVARQRTISPARSSPELPSLPPNDSGFVSDLPGGRDGEETDREKLWNGSEAGEPMQRRRFDNTSLGPIERMPTGGHGASQEPTSPDEIDFMSSFQEQMTSAIVGFPEQGGQQQNGTSQSSTNTIRTHGPPLDPRLSLPPQSQMHDFAPDANLASQATAQHYAVATFGSERPVDSHPQPSHGTTRTSGLTRSHTWSGGEPMSDGAVSTYDGSSRQPRKSTTAKRQDCIRGKLQEALEKGEMPNYCNNCGEIDTPTWRRAFMRIENGVPENIELSSAGTGIAAYEVLEPEPDGDQTPRYRIFKLSLTAMEWEVLKESEENKQQPDPRAFKQLNLCNSCGLWLNKKNAMRPHRVWAKSRVDKERSKRKRDEKRKNHSKKPRLENDQTTSDAVVPDSEADIPGARDGSEAPPSGDRTVDAGSQPLQHIYSASVNSGPNTQWDSNTAQAALQRAIQSSPVGLRGSKHSPIDVESDLTPKPTRRLLFPSPRQLGEIKSLADKNSSHPHPAPTSVPRTGELNAEDVDKENCPPATREGDGELAHLFEDQVSSKTTPTKGRPLEDFLKTPTPSSGRIPLTPQRSADDAVFITPSRMLRTPRTEGRAATIAPETPFTRQLNALLSDQNMDFSNFPMFNTPGRNNGANFTDFLGGDISSDFPMSSSPPLPLGFSVFEDPNTSTVGLWSGASIFDGSDAIMPEAPAGDSANGA